MIEYLPELFVWRALAGGVLAALLTAPLGCFVVWQRMAYFGDALAHSALLGVAFGLISGFSLSWSVLLCCVIVSLILVFMQKHHRMRSELSVDAHLGIVAHAGLAGGLVLLVFADNPRFDLEAYLFGDVLMVTISDLWRMLGVYLLLLIALLKYWKSLLLITVSEDMARVEGLPVDRLRLIFILLLACVVATAIQIIGVLLTASLLVIPAAAARRLSNTPGKMIVISHVLSLMAVIGGVLSSLAWDIQTGPAIVLAAVLIFVVLQFKRN